MNSRIVILAIAAVAFVQTNAGAQTTTIKNTGTKTVVITENEKSGVIATYEVPKGKIAPRAKVPDVVYVTGSAKRNPRLVASYDVPSDLYNGNEVMINDGVEKNKKRNINYLDFNGAKVPNDGGQYNK